MPARSPPAFTAYQAKDAWTWEHMALNRARVVAGPEALVRRIAQVIEETLRRERDADQLLIDVAHMRERIDQHHGTQDIWSVKHCRGGLVDIEFVAQYLQLRHAARHPDILTPNTADALLSLQRHGLLGDGPAEGLLEALRCCQRIQSFLRLTTDGPFEIEAAPAPLVRALIRAAFPDAEPSVTLAAATHRLGLMLAGSYRYFREIIGDPGAVLAKKRAPSPSLEQHSEWSPT